MFSSALLECFEPLDKPGMADGEDDVGFESKEVASEDEGAEEVEGEE